VAANLKSPENSEKPLMEEVALAGFTFFLAQFDCSRIASAQCGWIFWKMRKECSNLKTVRAPGSAFAARIPLIYSGECQCPFL
jgi:hypothetical protein